MVNESWLSSLWRTSRKSAPEPEKLVIGVLAHEVSNFMSKVVHLWQCLSDKQVERLREEVMKSKGVRKLVSEEEDFLLALMCGEIIENLEFLATFVGRLGKRCNSFALQRFEQVFNDLVLNNVDLYEWEYASKKMERKVKKMGRFVAVNASLNQELEVLAEFEHDLRRMQGGSEKSRICLLEFQQKVIWQRQEVKNLGDNSLRNRTYDYTVHLLARSLFTIFPRIKHVFGIRLVELVLGINDSNADRSHSISTFHPSSSPLGRSSPQKIRRLASVGPFKGCMTSGIDSPVSHSFTPVTNGAKDGLFACSNTLEAILPLLSSNRKELNTPPFTLGASALALHYANVIIVIEKMVAYPHLIGPDARNTLYNMLPTSLRVALRSRLKSYGKKLKSFDYSSDIVAKWSKTLTRILEWLVPLARNMIRWQSERNFEQKHLVSRTHVLLVQTFYFADRAKTEIVITTLLQGLNYLWREHCRSTLEAEIS